MSNDAYSRPQLFSIDDVIMGHDLVIVDSSGFSAPSFDLARDLSGKNTLKDLEMHKEKTQKELTTYSWQTQNLTASDKVRSPLEVSTELEKYVTILMSRVNIISTSCGGHGYQVGGMPYTRRPSDKMVKDTFAKNFNLLTSRPLGYKQNLLNLALLADKVRELSEALAGKNCYNGPLWDIELDTTDGRINNDVCDRVVAGAAIAYAMKHKAKVAVIANDKDIYRIILAVARAPSLNRDEALTLMSLVSVFRPPEDVTLGLYGKSRKKWFEETYGYDTIRRLVRNPLGELGIGNEPTQAATAPAVKAYRPK